MFKEIQNSLINPLNFELNPIRHLLALAGAHHFVDVSRIRVKEGRCPGQNEKDLADHITKTLKPKPKS
jgi:hypothetical protein